MATKKRKAAAPVQVNEFGDPQYIEPQPASEAESAPAPKTPKTRSAPAVRVVGATEARTSRKTKKAVQEAIPDVQEDKKALGAKIYSETIIFKLKQRKPGWRRQLTTEEIDAITAAKERGEVKDGDEFDRALVSFHKELLSKDAFRPIRALDKAFRDYLAYIEVKQSIVRGGQHLIPWRYVLELKNRFDEYSRQRDELAKEFALLRYEDAKAEARSRLGKLLYNEAQYPAPAAVMAATKLEVQWLSIDVPEVLKQVDANLFNEVKANFQQEWGNAADEMKTALRHMFREIIKRASDALAVKENGKPRRFNDTMVDSVNEFIRTFEGRDFANDAELKKLVEDTRKVMEGVTPDELRKDETIRMTAEKQINEVLAGLDELVVDVERQIRFDDEDDD